MENVIGPIYCETPATVGQYSGFFLEPINTLTSLVPVIFGVIALLYVYRHDRHAWGLYALAGLIGMTGVGSMFWHGFRTPFALSLDVLPGILAFFLFTFLWGTALRDRWFGYATIVTIVVFQAITLRLTEATAELSFILLFAIIAIIGMLLIAYTHHRARPLVWWGVGTLVLAAVAAVFRVTDLFVCHTIPFGTHFLWHVFLSSAALVGIIFLVKLHSYLAHLLPTKWEW